MLVAQLCPTLFDFMDCSPLGSSVMKFSRQGYCSGLLRWVLQIYRSGAGGNERWRDLPMAAWLIVEGLHLSTGLSLFPRTRAYSSGCTPFTTADCSSAESSGNTRQNPSNFFQISHHPPLTSHQKDPCQVQWEVNRFNVENWLRRELSLGTTGWK